MSAPPEGIAYLSLNSLSVSKEFDPTDPKQFSSHILIDIGLNGNHDGARIDDYNHPRCSKQGSSLPYSEITVMYGRDGNNLSRITRFKGEQKRAGKTFEAGFLPVPAPTPEERYLWIDCTYAIRGIYFPISPYVPWDYRNLAQYARLDFRHRSSLELPFARPYQEKRYPKQFVPSLKTEIEKARLLLSPAETFVSMPIKWAYPLDKGDEDVIQKLPAGLHNVSLHPYLRDLPRYNTGILGEKSGSKKHLFEEDDSETQGNKKFLGDWLRLCKRLSAWPQHKGRLEGMKKFAKENNLERKNKLFQHVIVPWIADRSVEEAGEDGKFEEHRELKRLELLMSTGGYIHTDEDSDRRDFSFSCDDSESHLQGSLHLLYLNVMHRIPLTDLYDEFKKQFLCPLKAIMASLDHPPDAIMLGKLPFEPTTKYGLGIQGNVAFRTIMGGRLY